MICLDCKHEDGTWINDREVDVWCKLDINRDCWNMTECEDFEEI